MKEDKEMGWRGGTTKVCLTHLKDAEGSLLIPPPMFKQREESPPKLDASSRLAGLEVGEEEAQPQDNGNGSRLVVTWSDLAEAHRSGDINRLALLARQLKADTEMYKSKVIAAQDQLIDHLTR
jgi:hypothetical protein